MPVGPIRPKPIEKLAAAVREVMAGIDMPVAQGLGTSHATSGYHTIINRSDIEVYYVDVLHPRSARAQWQDSFVARMEPLLIAKFGADRVQRKDQKGRKGFVVTLA